VAPHHLIEFDEKMTSGFLPPGIKKKKWIIKNRPCEKGPLGQIHYVNHEKNNFFRKSVGWMKSSLKGGVTAWLLDSVQLDEVCPSVQQRIQYFEALFVMFGQSSIP